MSELIEQLQETLQELYNLATERITLLESLVKEQGEFQWRPVSEELPEFGEKVRVVDRVNTELHGTGFSSQIARLSNQGEWEGVTTIPTHWQKIMSLTDSDMLAAKRKELIGD